MIMDPSRTTPTQPRRTSCDLWREITTKNHQGVDSAAPIQHNHMQRHTLRCSSKVIIPSMMAILVVFVLSTFTNVVSVPSVGAFHGGPSSMWVAPPCTRHRAEALSQLCRTRLSATNNNDKKQPGGGFGTASSSSPSSNKQKKKVNSSSKYRLQDALNDKPKAKSQQQQRPASSTLAKPYVKDEQSALIEQLAQKAATTPIGRVVSEFANQLDQDPFWELLPSLIASRFPLVPPSALERLAGFVRHALETADGTKTKSRPMDWVDDPYRPYKELHAYMPGLGPTQPFHDPARVPFCRALEENYEIIRQEYQALLQDPNVVKRFQSVTSMNYQSGWQTLVLFYNGHRIPDFPYHLCPTTTRLLETVPLAGRIAGFNRQQPQSGIPLHTDGNNLWLTTQMGMVIPDDDAKAAHIQVGPETRYWQTGKCLLYDTTYQHETYNAHPTQERVVLHVDFFNTLALTASEIEILQYIYHLREEFMKAEGVAKVGAQIL